jgi:hypothetical protein
MQVLNVIKVKNNVIDGVHSFAVIDDQLMDSVIDEAETFFTQLLRELVKDITDEEIEDALDDGTYQGANYSLNLFWSYIHNAQL